MENYQQTSMPGSAAPPKNNYGKQVLIIAGLLLLIFCACVGGCFALGGAGVVAVFREKAPVEETLDQFMQAMVARDTEKAFTLFSSRAQRQMEASEMEDMLAGNNYVLFEGYRRLEVNNLNISSSINADQDLPQGTVAKVNGIVYYEGDFTGKFDAVLEKEDDTWRLHNINITVPPNKFTP